ncbi:MAG: hypothetical protein HC902_09505 [Calothrix sp. SM1_5_4]|nr:hypothetical protein [Calothrix sp. SM1_5_4]
MKEWIYSEEVSPTRIRLQHVMFLADLEGKPIQGSELKHTGEDWEFEAPYYYDFVGPRRWEVRKLEQGTQQWTRRVTNLDDGPRYACASPWSLDKRFPEWSCGAFSPIPGRETRDMGRKDYNTLDRMTRLVAYDSSWLERQENVKTIDADGVRTPLAKEVGKNWYVRLPDSECAPIQGFIQERREFWQLVRVAWDEVLSGDRPFAEKPAARSPLRRTQSARRRTVKNKMDLKDPSVRKAVKDSILTIIRKYQDA